MTVQCPTSANTDLDALVISVLPDICWTPFGGILLPVPYWIVARLTAARDLATTVRQNSGSLSTLTVQSYLSNVSGDEAGTGGGILSGVFTGTCHPTKISVSTVRAEGRFILAHDDIFAMNCNAAGGLNTIGRLVYVKYVNGLATVVHPEQVGWWGNANVTPELENEVFRIAEKYQFNPYFLMAIMAQETGGSFASDQVQGGGGNGRGLIQFDNSLPDMYVRRTSAMAGLASAAVRDGHITQADLDLFVQQSGTTPPTVDPDLFTRVNAALVTEIMSLTPAQQMQYVDVYIDSRGITTDSPTQFDWLLWAINPGIFTSYNPENGINPDYNAAYLQYISRLTTQLAAEYELLGVTGPSLDTAALTAASFADRSALIDQLVLAGMVVLDTQHLTPCTGAKISFPVFAPG